VIDNLLFFLYVGAKSGGGLKWWVEHKAGSENGWAFLFFKLNKVFDGRLETII